MRYGFRGWYFMKKTKRRKKQRKKILKFLNTYAAIITIFVSILAFLFNGIIKYYQKSISTEFSMQYITVNINSDNWVEEIQKDDHISSYLEELKAPTINNDINKVLYEYGDKVNGYYVTYLIIEQVKDVEALDVKINFKKYGEARALDQKEINDLKIDKSIEEEVSEKIDYPIKKNDSLKVPISICKPSNEYETYPSDCYYVEYEGVSIEYRNKYLFSKREVPIREYLEHNVIIDGEVVTGRGSTASPSENKPWYLK